jgi:hypothetical protein
VDTNSLNSMLGFYMKNKYPKRWSLAIHKMTCRKQGMQYTLPTRGLSVSSSRY